MNDSIGTPQPHALQRRRFWHPIGNVKSSGLYRIYWILVGLLLLVGIPWYRAADTQDPLIAGVPLWAWVTIGSAVGIAALTAWAALRLWPADEGDDSDG